MNLILIFPPRANCTYIPLGITCLKSYFDKNHPAINTSIIDLNIETWHQIPVWINRSSFDQESKESNFFNFLKNKDNHFYDPESYDKIINTDWKEHNNFFTQLIKEAGFFLESSPNQDKLSFFSYIPNILGAQLKKFFEFSLELFFQTGGVPENILFSQETILGFSVMYPRQFIITLAIAKYVDLYFYQKNCRSQIKIILGGAALSTINCKDILRACSFIDLIISGEGEKPLEMVCTDQPHYLIPGLYYKHQDKIFSNEKQNPISLKTLPIPDFKKLPLEKYFNPDPVLPVYFSKGCAWRKCRFCAHNYSFSSYRTKRVEQFVDELEYYAKELKVFYFYFVDQYINEVSIEKIADEILKRNLKIYYHFMGRPCGNFNQELFHKIHQSGCRWICWGIETGSQKLLDMINKGTKVEEMINIMRMSKNEGISNLLMMIFGLPGSDEQEFKNTMDFINNVSDYIDALTESEFVLYKDSGFEKHAKAYQIKIMNNEVLCTINGIKITSYKLDYSFLDSNGNMTGTLGEIETKKWNGKKQWCFTPVSYHKFNAEHYLLYTVNGQKPS